MANQAASKAARRVYVVTEALPNEATLAEHLVRAGSQAQAIAHIVRRRFEAQAASTDDVLRLRDVEVQDAGAAE